MATQDNSIQSFKFAEGVTVRSTLDEVGSPWFVAADVCAALDLKNVTMALRRLDDDEQALTTIEGLTKGNDQANIVNESGLYSLILTSRKAEAKQFKKWVTGEVLPALRKNGKYEVKHAKPTALPTQAGQCAYDPTEFYLVHKSSVDTGACIATPNQYGTLTTSPIPLEAVAMLKAA